jgi:hypothetical protein
MVNQSFTAVVERAEGLSGTFATEPYEVGWAREAVVFLKVFRMTAGGLLEARAQISPDGIDWVDEGSSFSPATGSGLDFVKLTNFGSWVRIVGDVQGSGATADVVVYVALKA